jgi:hypothetical protein
MCGKCACHHGKKKSKNRRLLPPLLFFMLLFLFLLVVVLTNIGIVHSYSTVFTQFHNSFVFPNFENIKKEQIKLLSNTKLFALKEGSTEKLLNLRSEYDNLLSETINEKSINGLTLDEKNERIKALKVIFDCVNALKDIDRDLTLFEEHRGGSDETLKETANLFTKEFTECKEEIESRLNSLLE